MRASLLAVAVLASGLVACDTTDPRRGGFVGGVGGLVSGNYEDGLRRREAELDRLADAEAALGRRIDTARATSARLGRRIASLDHTLAKLRARQAALDARTGGGDALEAERTHLRTRMIELTRRNAERNRMLSELRDERDAPAFAEVEVDRDEAAVRQLMQEQDAALARLR